MRLTICSAIRFRFFLDFFRFEKIFVRKKLELKPSPARPPLASHGEFFVQIYVAYSTGNDGVFCLPEKGGRAGANRKNFLRDEKKFQNFSGLRK